MAQPVADRLEAVAGPFLKGQDMVPSDDHRDLLALHGAAWCQHAKDDEEAVVVDLDLGPLMGVGDVLDSQGVKPELCGDGLDGVVIGQAHEVDPEHALRGGERRQLGDRSRLHLAEPAARHARAKGDGRNRRCRCRRIGHQEAGCCAGGRTPFVDQPGFFAPHTIAPCDMQI
jgi:hypothetical protein